MGIDDDIIIFKLVLLRMRSLFTNDIPGAVPRHRYYEKELYLRRHLEEVERFGRKNPEQKRVI